MALRQAAALPRADASEDLARVGRELSRLDPWSFWTVPVSNGDPEDFLVVGTTGAFVITACSLDGYLVTGRIRPLVTDRPIPGLKDLRRAARRLTGRLSSMGVFVEAEPILCLTRATVGAPFVARGVRLLGVGALVREIAAREKVLLGSKAKRAATSFGAVMPAPTAESGDE